MHRGEVCCAFVHGGLGNAAPDRLRKAQVPAPVLPLPCPADWGHIPYLCEPNVTRLAHRDSIHPTSLAHHVRDALLPQQGPGCRPPRHLLIFPVPWRTRLPGHCPPPLSDALPAAQPAASAWPSTPRLAGTDALPTPLGSPTPGCPPPLPRLMAGGCSRCRRERRERPREGGAGRRPPRRLLCFCFTLKRRAKCALRSRTGAFPLPL